MEVKQVRISEAICRFADVIADSRHEAVLAEVDPAKVHLANLLVSMGRYADRMGWNIRGLSQEDMNDLANVDRVPKSQVQLLADQLRRFAEMLERCHDKVRHVDPGYVRLGFVTGAIALYSRWLGVDVGLGSGRGIVIPRNMNLPKLPRGV